MAEKAMLLKTGPQADYGDMITTNFNEITKITPYVTESKEDRLVRLYDVETRNKTRVLKNTLKLLSKIELWRRYSDIYPEEGLDGQGKLVLSKFYSFDVTAIVLLIVVASSYYKWSQNSLIAVDKISMKTRSVRERIATEQIYKWESSEKVNKALASFKINESTEMWKKYLDWLVSYPNDSKQVLIDIRKNEFTLSNPFLAYVLFQIESSDEEKDWIVNNDNWGQKVTLRELAKNQSALLFNIVERLYPQESKRVFKYWRKLLHESELRESKLSVEEHDFVRQDFQRCLNQSLKNVTNNDLRSDSFPILYNVVNKLGSPKRDLIDVTILSFENDNQLIEFVKKVRRVEDFPADFPDGEHEQLEKRLQHSVKLVFHAVDRILKGRADEHRHVESDIPIVTRELDASVRENIVIMMNLITNARVMLSNKRRTYTILWETFEINLSNIFKNSL